MTLVFTETAPGVHTSTWTHPKTNQRHNMAIIESCDAWQLFIDAELVARDQPSFEAAVQRAEIKLGLGKRGNLGISSSLVLASLGGALVIVGGLIVGPVLSRPSDRAVAKPQMTAALQAEITSTSSVAVATNEERSAALTDVVSTVSVSSPVTPSPSVASNSIAQPTANPDVRQFSASNTVLSVAPEVISVTENADIAVGSESSRQFQERVPEERPVDTTAVAAKPLVAKRSRVPVTALPPIVRPFRPEPVIIRAPQNSTSVTDRIATSSISTTAARSAVTVSSPPLPTPAPVVTRPIIRALSAENERPALNERLARVEGPKAQEKEIGTATHARPKKEPRKVQRQSRTVRKAAGKRVRRQLTPRRQPNPPKVQRSERRRLRTAEIRQPVQSRRMVCFAHTCQFR